MTSNEILLVTRCPDNDIERVLHNDEKLSCFSRKLVKTRLYCCCCRLDAPFEGLTTQQKRSSCLSPNDQPKRPYIFNDCLFSRFHFKELINSMSFTNICDHSKEILLRFPREEHYREECKQSRWNNVMTSSSLRWNCMEWFISLMGEQEDFFMNNSATDLHRIWKALLVNPEWAYRLWTKRISLLIDHSTADNC